eukprot:1054344-Prymnesium_polylepis.1
MWYRRQIFEGQGHIPTRPRATRANRHHDGRLPYQQKTVRSTGKCETKIKVPPAEEGKRRERRGPGKKSWQTRNKCACAQ